MQLDDAAIEAHWREKNPAMLGIFRRMEADESWSLDRPDKLESRIVALGKVLSDMPPNQLQPAQRDALFRVLGFMRSGRAFRVLSYLDQENPGFIEGLLAQADRALASTSTSDPDSEHVAARIHLDRFLYLDRFSLLSRVFSKQRVAHLQQILEDIS